MFHISLVVVMSAVLVVSSPGHLIRLPPDMMGTLLGSDFCSQKSTTLHAYVGVLPSTHIFIICVWFTTKMRFFHLVFVLSLIWAMHPISFPNSVCHVSRTSGSEPRVIVFPLSDGFSSLGVHHCCAKVFYVDVVEVVLCCAFCRAVIQEISWHPLIS